MTGLRWQLGFAMLQLRARQRTDDRQSLSITLCAFGIYGVDLGVGHHVPDVPLSNVSTILINMLAGDEIFDGAMAFARHSALFFYARIFVTNQPTRFRYFLWTLHGLNLAWLIILVILQPFTCNPPRKAWTPGLPGTCQPDQTNWVASAASSAVLDLLVLLAPMPMVLRLQLRRSTKCFVAAVLFCGAIVFVVSLGRLVASTVHGDLVDNSDQTFTIVPTLYWALTEPAVAVTSICLPSISHLVRKGVRQGPKALVSRHSGVAKLDFAERSEFVTVNEGRAHSVETYLEPLRLHGDGQDVGKDSLQDDTEPSLMEMDRVHLRNVTIDEVV